MPEDFVIARDTEPGSTLPYLLRVRLGDGIILKAKDTWPGTGKVYCHGSRSGRSTPRLSSEWRCGPAFDGSRPIDPLR